jgi:hypothetical protein
MDKSTIERMLRNGTLQTGEFPPTAPPLDVPLPPLPPEVLETKRLSRLYPPPRIIAAGTDDPLKLFWEMAYVYWFGPQGRKPYFPKFSLSDYESMSVVQQSINNGDEVAVSNNSDHAERTVEAKEEEETSTQQASLAV